MSSCPEELQRNRPTEGMTFSRQQASKLFENYLNKQVSWFEICEDGLNNLIFFIQCENDSTKYVLKIGGKIWKKIKTESEVAAIQLINQYTTIALPRILSFSSDRNNEFGLEWIIMTCLMGRPLRTSSKMDDIWPKLNLQQQKSIIDQLVQYVFQLPQKIPRSNQIGNYQLNGKIGPDSDGMGPWNNYRHFYHDRLNRQIYTLQVESIFDPIRDSVLQSLKDFDKISLPDFSDLPNVFTDNDLGVQNLIVNDQNEIQEYFRSYKPIIYDQQLTNYLYDQLEKYQIQTPRAIPHFKLLQKMNDLLQCVAPWYLTNLTNPQHTTVQIQLIKNRDKLKNLVQQIKAEVI